LIRSLKVIFVETWGLLELWLPSFCQKGHVRTVDRQGKEKELL
jgi:hypothetical protein